MAEFRSEPAPLDPWPGAIDDDRTIVVLRITTNPAQAIAPNL